MSHTYFLCDSIYQTILVAQMVKHLSTMWETWVRPLGREDSPGAGPGTPLQHSCLENPHGQRSLVGYSSWGCKELDTTEQLTPPIPTWIIESTVQCVEHIQIHLVPQHSTHFPIYAVSEKKKVHVNLHKL